MKMVRVTMTQQVNGSLSNYNDGDGDNDSSTPWLYIIFIVWVSPNDHLLVSETSLQATQKLSAKEFAVCVQINHDICANHYRTQYLENDIGVLRECTLVCLDTVGKSKFVFPTNEGMDAMRAAALPILEAYMKIKNIEPKLRSDM
ncbi:hypothetical protein CYY_002965 [Polysphondylium violaceum]|uniref:Uncharacterized protein n=1 Tax=Polysphondylium violaceum TaxID=133409 RepID=A0A8J4V6D4_9MYCE|nr:hypothetical protein CYY_002965 [Polysphondylium violaceum]